MEKKTSDGPLKDKQNPFLCNKKQNDVYTEALLLMFGKHNIHHYKSKTNNITLSYIGTVNYFVMFYYLL